MNSKQIQTIRDSLGKVVRMLTSRSIKVTQRGMQAYVGYHLKTGAIVALNIPYLPDDASDEFVASIQGFVDHEVGHVLYSDSETLRKAHKLGSRVMSTANIIEDVYVERKMAEGFSGSVANLNELRGFFLNKMVLPKAREALKAGNAEAALSSMIMVAMRAWGGQTAAIDAMADNPELAALTDPIKKRLGEDIVNAIRKCNSSEECLSLAQRVVKALEPAPAPPAPPAPPPPAPAPTPEPTDDEPEDEDDGDDEPADEGSTSVEADEGDGHSETESEGTEAGTAGTGETDPHDETESPEAAEDEGDAPEEDLPPGDDGSSGESSAPDDGDDAGEDPDDGDDAGDEPGDGISAVDDDAASEDLPTSGSGREDDSDDTDADPDTGDDERAAKDDTSPGGSTPSGDDDEDGAPDAGASGSDDAETPERDEADTEDMSAVMDDVKDFDEEVSKGLTERARAESVEADYLIFSTDWDKLEQAPDPRNPASAGKMVEETQAMIATMQKSLERAFAAQDKVMWSAGQRRGRINPGSLFKTATGDDRVFRKRYETQARNTALSLLIDCSGSMNWDDRIGTAGKAAFALSQTLERLRLRHEVLGFTTRTSSAMQEAMKSERDRLAGHGVRYGRNEAIYMPVFKGFDERLGPDQIGRIAHLTEGPDWLRENVDGESVQIAGTRLLQQRAERHVLIVLSDGSPACPPGSGLNPHLKKVVKDLEASGVEVVGVGIQTSVVSHFYSRSVVLDDLDSLPTEVMGQLTRVLLS